MAAGEVTVHFVRIAVIIFVTTLIFVTHAAFGEEPVPLQVPGGAIDSLMAEAIHHNLIAGGVVLVGDSQHDIFFKAYGRMSSLPGASPMTTDAIFDIASLTKVVATAPSVMKLAEAGKVSLVDSAVTWFPELGSSKKDLLLFHLLTHTSCLDDIQCSLVNPLDNLLEALSTRRLEGNVGNRFRYADINFILLGELVNRASGMSLDRYALETFYRPLGMTDTGFHLRPEQFGRCVPTLGGDGRPVAGSVQDFNARILGGVAGHAGVFSTAGDLGIFCRMFLGRGIYRGVKVLSERTVAQMTAPYYSREGKVVRGLGWDISSPYSSPRGDGFSSASYGHTGYSGTSIWIDPSQDIFVVLLTSRLEYRDTSVFNRLRKGVSTLALRQFSPRMNEVLLKELEAL